MVQYVDGFVLPVPKKKIADYRRMAKIAGKVWMEHGAVEYRECVGDDLAVKFGLPYTKGTKVKPGETVIFSWIVYKSRAHRDKVLKKVMADPRLKPPQDMKTMPFDHQRMMWGGFKTIVLA